MNDPRCTLEQQRAADALTRIHALRDCGDYGNYRSYAERLPAQIVMNGLGQALAMVRSRCPDDDGAPRRGRGRGGGDRERGASPDDGEQATSREAIAYRFLFQHVGGWLCRDHEHAPYRGAELDHLLMKLSTCDQDTYVRAHAEALAYLDWLKKFARAFLARSKEDE